MTKVTDRRRGLVKGEPNRFVNGHSRKRSLTERFWEKVDRGKPNECWEWQATLRNGYGLIGGSAGRDEEGYRRYYLYAHRLSYKLAHGEIPEGLHIDHLCRNRKCVNPAHLEAVTQAENNRRAERERNELGQFA